MKATGTLEIKIKIDSKEMQEVYKKSNPGKRLPKDTKTRSYMILGDFIARTIIPKDPQSIKAWLAQAGVKTAPKDEEQLNQVLIGIAIDALGWKKVAKKKKTKK